MTPFFLACEKNTDTTTSTDSSTSTSPVPTVSIKPATSAKPAETSTQSSIVKPEVSVPKPVKKEAKDEEKKESFVVLKGNPSNIYPTVFLGDSLTVKLGEFGGRLNIEDAMIVAEIGKSSSWLLEQAQELGKSGKFGRYSNAVVLIGSNDLGGSGPAFTAPQIFGRIEKIYRTLHGDSDFDGKPDFDGVDRVYGVTIPPFKGKNVLSKEEIFDEINNKRLEINQLIKGSKLPFRVIDLAATQAQGGVADNDDPGQLSLIGPNNVEYKTIDGLHFPKKWLRLIYERELGK